MFNTPDPKPDFSKIDQEINNWWKENNTFEKSIEMRAGAEDYIFYDGPPFITGIPHYGTILSSVSKDVIPRFQTMKGKRVERLWGWDCHGLPIEEKVEKQMGLNGHKEIQENLEDFINNCYEWNRIGFENWKWYVEKVGRWADMDNAYRTLDQDYMESVWWVFKQIWDKDLVYKGRRTSLFSTDSSTPVSGFEVSMDPDNYRDTEDIAVSVKFELDKDAQPKLEKKLKTSKQIKMVAWTTTPWTLPSNFALAVNPTAKYSALENDSEVLIMAEELVENMIDPEEYSTIGTLTAKDLVGLSYTPLFDYFEGNENDFKIYESDYVTVEDGTGVLHVAPAFGEADFEMGNKWNLSFESDIDKAGVMNVGNWKGEYLRDANPKIANHLEESGKLLKQEKYTHRLPYYRYDNPLIYMTEENYFVNIQKIKGQLIETNKDINWIPEHFKEGRFNHILETAPDWSVSRSRFWGTVMPIWESEDGDQIIVGSRDDLMNLVNDSDVKSKIQKVNLELHADCKSSLKECEQEIQDFLDSDQAEMTYGTTQENLNFLRNKFFGETELESSVKPISDKEQRAYYVVDGESLDLHRPFIDRVTFTKDGKEYKRVEFTLDVWMDSGSMPFAQFHYPFVNKEKFEDSFPGDYIAEYTGQIRAWFYLLHVISNIVFDKPAFKNVLVNGVLAGTDGRKMSKSFGNYPDPKQTLEKYGGDALRLYLLGSPIMIGGDTNFSEDDLKLTVREFLLPFWNVQKYFVTYANMFDWSPTESDLSLTLDDHIAATSSQLDKWILTQLKDTTNLVNNHLGKYNTPKAITSLRTFLDELSKWFIRRSRSRFAEGSPEALNTLYLCLTTFTKLVAPILPFTSEKVYQHLIAEPFSKQPESVHFNDFPETTSLTKEEIKLLNQMELVRSAAELGQSLRTTNGLKVRQPLATVHIATKAVLDNWMKDLISEELNVKEVDIVTKLPESKTIVFTSVGKKELSVGLETELSPELKEEGLIREITRTFQAMRKKAGLQMSDFADITYQTEDEILNKIIKDNSEVIMQTVNAKSLQVGSSSEDKKVNGIEISIGISKHE